MISLPTAMGVVDNRVVVDVVDNVLELFVSVGSDCCGIDCVGCDVNILLVEF